MHALEHPDLHGHLRLTGPESLSFHDVAERLTQHLGRQVSYIDVPPAAYRDAAVAAGLDPAYADALVEVAAYYGAQPPFVDTALIEQARAQPARTLDDFIP